MKTLMCPAAACDYYAEQGDEFQTCPHGHGMLVQIPKHNPKHIQAQKDGKLPLEYLVTSMFALDAAVHKHGADKYGIRNWRLDKILASTYEGAMLRHLAAWIAGEDIDPDSGKPHLTHLRACCAVVLDAQMFGTLIDDRNRMESKGAGPIQPGPDQFALRLEGYPNPRCAICRADPCVCDINGRG